MLCRSLPFVRKAKWSLVMQESGRARRTGYVDLCVQACRIYMHMFGFNSVNVFVLMWQLGRAGQGEQLFLWTVQWG